MLDRALAWAAQGWPVFPCNTNGIPALKEWQKQATTDEATIRAWDWTDKRVAAVPGLAGCFVIDVDVKNGKDGETSLAKLEAEHGFEAWEYPQQATPSGGKHIFLFGTARTSVQLSLGNGLDTRGGSTEGGLGFIYCYDGPPSEPHSCPPAPSSLIRRLGATREVSEDRETPRVELDQPANVERALAYIKDLPCPEEGQRNISVFKTACTLKDLGLSMAKIFEVMEEFPSVTGYPPLCEENPEEFNATVRSAYKNGQRQPGIDAIDEAVRDSAARGFDVGEPKTSRLLEEIGARSRGAMRGQIGEEGEEDDVGAPSPEKEGGSARKRKRFTLWSEERERDPPPWLIRGLLPKVALAGMYAPGGHYKSFIGLDMLLAIASGKEEWAGLKISDPGAPVVYVAGEGSAAARTRAWEKHHGVSELLGDRLVTYHGIDLMDENQLDGLREDLESLYAGWGRGPAAIMFDTLARAAPGQDENSAKDMGLFVQKVDTIKDWAQTCVLLIHHTPKATNEWRGSSAVWNALDVGLEVRKKGANNAALKLTRTKDGHEGAQWKIALQEVETGRERDGEKEASLVVTAVERVVQEKATVDAEKVAAAARARSMTVNDHRAHTAARILEATAPGYEISYGSLVSQIMVENQGASREAVSEWVRSVVKKGEVQGEHPLAKYVSNIKPLAFQRAASAE